MIDLHPGDVFTLEIPGIAQDQMNVYGELMGTNGAIHTDPAYAATTPQKKTIVQGMLVMAPLDVVMRRLVGEDRWLSGGVVETKIVGMTHPGEATILELTVKEAGADRAAFAFTIKAGDKTVLVGDVSA
jgi:acyl dehydratase